MSSELPVQLLHGAHRSLRAPGEAASRLTRDPGKSFGAACFLENRGKRLAEEIGVIVRLCEGLEISRHLWILKFQRRRFPSRPVLQRHQRLFELQSARGFRKSVRSLNGGKPGRQGPPPPPPPVYRGPSPPLPRTTNICRVQLQGSSFFFL